MKNQSHPPKKTPKESAGLSSDELFDHWLKALSAQAHLREENNHTELTKKSQDALTRLYNVAYRTGKRLAIRRRLRANQANNT